MSKGELHLLELKAGHVYVIWEWQGGKAWWGYLHRKVERGRAYGVWLGFIDEGLMREYWKQPGSGANFDRTCVGCEASSAEEGLLLRRMITKEMLK